MISIEDAKRQVGQTSNHEDGLIQSYIDAAGETVAQYTGRIWDQATFTDVFDGFSDEMTLTRSPLGAVSSVTYLDADGVSQTLATSGYVVDNRMSLAKVKRAYGTTWPTTQAGDQQTVTITYTAGYTAATLPEPLRMAALMLVSSLYAQPENHSATQLHEVPVSAQFLLAPYRILI